MSDLVLDDDAAATNDQAVKERPRPSLEAAATPSGAQRDVARDWAIVEDHDIELALGDAGGFALARMLM
jgi:hypothetical protein